MPMTAHKAHAGGLSAAVTVVAMALLSQHLGIVEAPDKAALQQAIEMMVAAGVGYGLGFAGTWFGPANREKGE